MYLRYLREAAEKLASKQLAEAMQTEDPKKIKGAIVAARKLGATHVPEFEAASAHPFDDTPLQDLCVQKWWLFDECDFDELAAS